MNMASDSQPTEVTELLGMLGVGSVLEWLDLPQAYSPQQAKLALGGQLRWAQARLNNPRYGTLAHHMLRHKNAVERVVLAGATLVDVPPAPVLDPTPQTLSAPEPAPLPVERSPEQTLREFWEGLKLARGLNSDQRMRLLGREAKRLGVSLRETQSLITVPAPSNPPKPPPPPREVPEQHRVERLGRPTSSRSTLERSRELARRGKQREQDRRLPSERRSQAMVDLAEGLRGLMLQGLLQPTAQESLVRQAYRGGLAPNRARAAVQRATEQWRTFSAGLHDPYLQLGWERGQPLRADYLARRRALLQTLSTWAELEELLLLDAAYASLRS